MMDDDFQNSPFSIVLIVPGSGKAIQVEQISPETTKIYKRAQKSYIFLETSHKNMHMLPSGKYLLYASLFMKFQVFEVLS